MNTNSVHWIYDIALKVFIGLQYLLHSFFIYFFFPPEHQSVIPVGGAITVGQTSILSSAMQGT